MKRSLYFLFIGLLALTLVQCGQPATPKPEEPTSPPGCRFHIRCPAAQAICREQKPPLRMISPSRWAACHLEEENR